MDRWMPSLPILILAGRGGVGLAVGDGEGEGVAVGAVVGTKVGTEVGIGGGIAVGGAKGVMGGTWGHSIFEEARWRGWLAAHTSNSL